MGLCRDPLTKLINSYGFAMLRMPRPDIVPGDVLRVDREGAAKLGPLPDLLVDGKVALPPALPARVSDISGKSSGKMNASLGVKFLQKVIPNFDAGGQGLMLGMKNMQYTLSNIVVNSTDPAKIGTLLAKATINFSNPVLSDFFADRSDLAVVTETLVARVVQVSWFGDNTVAAEATVSAVKIATEVGIKAQRQSESSFTLAFEGIDPLVIGIKAFDLEMKDGDLTFRPKRDVEDYSAGEQLLPAFEKHLNGELLDLG